VPNYYYKALLMRSISNGEPRYRAVAFWFNHQASTRAVQWSDAITVRELERRTGIDFFSGLEREIQDMVEPVANRWEWGF
jgi:endonuclease G